MSKRSRISHMTPPEENAAAEDWWANLDTAHKYRIYAEFNGPVDSNAGTESAKLEDYAGKTQNFLKDLPAQLIEDWGCGRTVMNYVLHTNSVVVYAITNERPIDWDCPEYNEDRDTYDMKLVALFYANTGNGKNRPYPVARRTTTSEKMHGNLGTNPVWKHLVIEDKNGRALNFGPNTTWCNQFLWSLGFHVAAKF